MSHPSSDQIAAQYQFAELAGQYYAAGRFAALTHCIPVAGNLLHHAVEMFVKCALTRTHSLAELKTFGHKLPALWVRFKEIHTALNCAHLDDAIAELDRFERLRYPDSVVREGMQVVMSVSRAHFARLPKGPQPPYHLVLEDVDEVSLISASASGLSSQVFKRNHGEIALRYMYLHNQYPILDSP
jgi:hypothetical protein